MAVRTHQITRPDGVLRVDADDTLAGVVESLLAHLAELPAQQLANDFRVDLGWSDLSLAREGTDWRLRGPDVTGDDPTALADDITPHLIAVIEQGRVATLLGVATEPIRFDAEISVEHGALAGDAVYLRRSGSVPGSGWHLGPLTAEAGGDVHLHALPAYEVVRSIPAAVGYLVLPEDYLVGVVGGGIDAVFDGQGTRVMNPGGELRIEAHPHLIERASKELGLTPAEVTAHARHHPELGYFMVWRAEDDPVMLALHPNGEQLRFPTLVHPDRVEQHWTDGDRTPPGYVLG